MFIPANRAPKNTGAAPGEPWTWKDFLGPLLFAAAFFAVFTFILGIGTVSGPSMEPSYGEDTVYIFSRWTRPQRRDVVLIRSRALQENIIKRVIGLPGDTLEIRRNTVYLNGLALDEPYVEYDEMWDQEELAVPEGTLFVMGDNRTLSLDSRSPLLGPVPQDEVVGTVLFSFRFPFPALLDFVKHPNGA